MNYRAPLSEIVFAMNHVAGLERGVADGIYPDLADGAAATILGEAGKMAEGVLAPLNVTGDEFGATLLEGVVTTAPGFAEAYRQWREGGWNALTAPEEFGGMGLPHLLNAACTEFWNAANMGFSLCPLLTVGAIEAVHTHATPALQKLYLEKLVSGEWTGTMNLTEPQAGSDLNALRAKAEPWATAPIKCRARRSTSPMASTT